MKVLFFANTSLYPHHFGVLMDEAEIMLREGHDVYFCYCNKAIRCCTPNYFGKKSNCDLCVWTTKNALRRLSKDIHILKSGDYIPTKIVHPYEFNTLDDIRAIEYKNVQIGYGVLSTYISMTRNNEPIFDDVFKKYINTLLQISAQQTDACDTIIKEIDPDLVCLFNGRLFEQKPMHELAISKGKQVRCYEVIGNTVEGHYKIQFENCNPLNIKGYTQKVEEYWADPDVSLEEKMKIGSSFYINRRNGISTGDKVYTKNQKTGVLPDGWDSSKRNFAIFNSSEDEIASIGDEYAQMNYFNSQIEGIKHILLLAKDHEDIYFYLRIHPNLAGIHYSYHMDLYKLDKEFPNVSVIPADAKISTYDLMESAEKIIVFGSTMGLESTYWKKPVINMSGADYALSNVAYMPKTEDELKQTLFDTLVPKDNINAIKFGYLKMVRKKQGHFQIVDYNWNWHSLFNKDYLFVNYQKLFGSKLLFVITQLFMGKVYSLLDNSKPLTIPTLGK